VEDLGGARQTYFGEIATYYSAKAHFEDEHLSRHFLPNVMREDVMREGAGVLRLTLYASLAQHAFLFVQKITVDGVLCGA
jgi:hypothetical protein